MNGDGLLPRVRIKCDQSGMDLARALAWIKENIDSSKGCILVEMPEKTIWTHAGGLPEAEALATCASILAFDNDNELRFEKEYAQTAGYCRMTRVASDGIETLERRYGYLLAGGKGRVAYAEHFTRHPESGMFQPLLGRFCGVEDKP